MISAMNRTSLYASSMHQKISNEVLVRAERRGGCFKNGKDTEERHPTMVQNTVQSFCSERKLLTVPPLLVARWNCRSENDGPWNLPWRNPPSSAGNDAGNYVHGARRKSASGIVFDWWQRQLEMAPRNDAENGRETWRSQNGKDATHVSMWHGWPIVMGSCYWYCPKVWK